MEISALTERLLACELRPDDPDDSAGRAAFRVCEKLRPVLSTLAGSAGYRSLLARSLVLARARAPWLAEVTVAADSSLLFPEDAQARLEPGEFARGGSVLVGELLALLAALIGETLTLRLVRNAWSDIDAHRPKISTDPS